MKTAEKLIKELKKYKSILPYEEEKLLYYPLKSLQNKVELAKINYYSEDEGCVLNGIYNIYDNDN